MSSCQCFIDVREIWCALFYYSLFVSLNRCGLFFSLVETDMICDASYVAGSVLQWATYLLGDAAWSVRKPQDFVVSSVTVQSVVT